MIVVDASKTRKDSASIKEYFATFDIVWPGFLKTYLIIEAHNEKEAIEKVKEDPWYEFCTRVELRERIKTE